jgi:hypothetical protein
LLLAFVKSKGEIVVCSLVSADAEKLPRLGGVAWPEETSQGVETVHNEE